MIKRLRVTVDGKSYDVTVESPEEASQAAIPAPVAAGAPPSAVPAPLPAPQPAPHKQVSSGGLGDVPSPLSGRVTAIVVKTGQDVKEGDHLVTLEAMKMNTFVFAPRSGKVTVSTEVGAVVEEGQLLASIA